MLPGWLGSFDWISHACATAAGVFLKFITHVGLYLWNTQPGLAGSATLSQRTSRSGADVPISPWFNSAVVSGVLIDQFHLIFTVDVSLVSVPEAVWVKVAIAGWRSVPVVVHVGNPRQMGPLVEHCGSTREFRSNRQRTPLG